MKTTQLPLMQTKAESIELVLAQITPPEHLRCAEPDDELIKDIATYGVPPILVCPETRFKGQNGKELYYPLDGKRRMLALHKLVQMGFEVDGKSIAEMPFTAMLRRDLTPLDQESYRLSYVANAVRSENVVTNIEAIKSAIKVLGVDVFTKDGRIQVANYLGTSPQTVGKIARGLLVDDAVYTAYTKGDISGQTLTAIINLRDLQAKEEITEKIKNGDKVTASDVQAYGHKAKQAVMIEAMADKPQQESASENLLQDAIQILVICLPNPKLRVEAIEKALVLLRNLAGE